MTILISFILSLYIGAFILLLYVINKQKQRIYELSDMNDSLYKQLEFLTRTNEEQKK